MSMTNADRWALLEELRALVERHHKGNETRDDAETLYVSVERLLMDIAEHRDAPRERPAAHPVRVQPEMMITGMPVIADSIEAVIPEGWNFALCVLAPTPSNAILCAMHGDNARIRAALSQVVEQAAPHPHVTSHVTPQGSN